jgi:hypothetical protein
VASASLSADNPTDAGVARGSVCAANFDDAANAAQTAVIAINV